MDIELKKKLARNWFKILQDMICNEIEKLDGSLFSDCREEDLRGALDKNQKEEEKLDENETEKSEDLNSTYLEDYQLSRALDLLNGLKVYQSINSN